MGAERQTKRQKRWARWYIQLLGQVALPAPFRGELVVARGWGQITCQIQCGDRVKRIVWELPRQQEPGPGLCRQLTATVHQDIAAVLAQLRAELNDQLPAPLPSIVRPAHAQ